MATRCVLGAGVIAIALAGCSLDDLTKPNQAEATPTAGSSISRELVTRKASAAMAAEVVGRKGEHLLCRLVDHYKERTTTYYICREQTCAGKEILVQNVSPKTKSGCINACRKLEDVNRARTSGNSYCVN